MVKVKSFRKFWILFILIMTIDNALEFHDAWLSNLLFKQWLWNPHVSSQTNHHTNAHHACLFVFRNLSYKFMPFCYWNANLLIKFFSHVFPIIFFPRTKTQIFFEFEFLLTYKNAASQIDSWNPTFYALIVNYWSKIIVDHVLRKQDYHWSCFSGLNSSFFGSNFTWQRRESTWCVCTKSPKKKAHTYHVLSCSSCSYDSSSVRLPVSLLLLLTLQTSDKDFIT